MKTQIYSVYTKVSPEDCQKLIGGSWNFTIVSSKKSFICDFLGIPILFDNWLVEECIKTV